MNLAQFEHTDDGLAWIFQAIGWLIVHWPIGLLVLGMLWWIGLQVWPAKVCPRCEGAGFRKGLIGVRTCGRCDGGGLLRRWGARDD